MTNSESLPRSPLLMSARDTALLVVDVQEKLMPLIPERERIVWNIGRLLRAAAVLGVPAVATEQYPKGLGPTIESLVEHLGEIPEKLAFSCGECGSVFADFREQGRDKILVVGIEAHVCVQQTVLDLMADGFSVYLAADAIGARGTYDFEIAMRRMDSCGAQLVTTEAAMFELCERAGSEKFKQISRLVQESPPAS